MLERIEPVDDLISCPLYVVDLGLLEIAQRPVFRPGAAVFRALIVSAVETCHGIFLFS
ncbi:hypothetical protein [Roseovarius sp. A-2]|uniref:hypothetical protein n=1 Tax=Roseovarius sp. A-2 TaxID=1570360 RepID=UPI001C38FD6B|nr:hypothetical protein [Roseovarius sp. A-2]